MPSIWKLGADCNMDLNIRTELAYFQNHFVAQPIIRDWKPPEIRIVGKSRRVRDFVSWMNSVPVISEAAKNALDPLIGDHCEILPLIELKKKHYFAVNVLTTIDCLNREDSDILYSTKNPGRINYINSYSLYLEKVPDRSIYIL